MGPHIDLANKEYENRYNHYDTGYFDDVHYGHNGGYNNYRYYNYDQEYIMITIFVLVIAAFCCTLYVCMVIGCVCLSTKHKPQSISNFNHEIDV